MYPCSWTTPFTLQSKPTGKKQSQSSGEEVHSVAQEEASQNWSPKRSWRNRMVDNPCFIHTVHCGKDCLEGFEKGAKSTCLACVLMHK